MPTFVNFDNYGVFTLTVTKSDTMATVPNGIDVSMQYDHAHTTIHKPFLSVSVSVTVSVKAY